jgi:hypothetical protein
VGDIVDDPGDIVVLPGDSALNPLERLPVDLLSASSHSVARLDRPYRHYPAVNPVVTFHACCLPDDGRERLPGFILCEFVFYDCTGVTCHRSLLTSDLADDSHRQSGARKRHPLGNDVI